jgi:glycosyltransferase involved in cell wall biosynthesis
MQTATPTPLAARRDTSEVSAAPLVSVTVRSYQRLPHLLELLDALTRQDHPNFELVVIEQSSDLHLRAHRAALARFARDPRIRILSYPVLGAGRARIEAARQARGEVIVFMDDDDLPVGTQWLTALVRNFDDPRCMAVSGRQVSSLTDVRAPTARPRDLRMCLRYSPLRMPRGRMRHGSRIEGVTQVAGGNAAIRRSAIERAGGWDPEDDHDEDSFAFRFAKVKRAGEYFAYDPLATMWRRLDAPGGLARRKQSVAERVRAELRYSHRVVRKYYPGRFHALYPCYVTLAATRAVAHVRQSQPERSLPSLLSELVRLGPGVYLRELGLLLANR